MSKDVSIPNLLGPHDAVAVQWAEGDRDGAMVALVRRIEADDIDTRELVQLLLWYTVTDDILKHGKLIVKLAKHVKLGEKPLAGESAALVRMLLQHTDPATEAHQLDARFMVLVATVVEPKHGHQAAAKLYQAAMQRDPKYARAYVGFVQCIMHLRKYKKSLQAIDIGLSHVPGCAELYRLGMYVASKLGEGRRAMDYAHRWLLLDPVNTEALTRVGQTLFAKGEYAECRRIFEGAVAAEPTNPVWRNMIAALWIQEGVRNRQSRAFDLARRELMGSLALDGAQTEPREKMRAIEQFTQNLRGEPPLLLQMAPEMLDASAPVLLTSDGLDSTPGMGRSNTDFDAELLSSLPDSVGSVGMPIIGESEKPKQVVVGELRETHEVDDIDPYAR